MKYLFILLFQLSMFVVLAQSTFSNLHGTNIDLEAFTDIQDVGDGFVLLLQDNNVNYEDDEVAIARHHFIKYNYEGDVILENIHYEYDSLFALITGIDVMRQTLDSGFAIGCTLRKRDTTVTTNYYSISQKAALIKYDENLEKEWMFILGENWDDPTTQYIANDVWQMPDGSYYLFGGRLKDSDLEGMLVKITEEGQMEWVEYIDALPNFELGFRIVVRDETILVVIREKESLNPSITSDLVFAKLSLEGEVLEVVSTIEQDDIHTDKGIVLLADNSIASVSILDDYRYRCDQYSWDLDTLWADEFILEEIPNTFNFFGIEQDSNGDIITVGSSFNNDSGQYGFLRKYSIVGELIWTRKYQHIDDQFAIQELYDVTPTSDGGYVACGSVAASWADIFQDGWVIKVDSMGCLVPGCDSLDVSINEVNNLGSEKVWFKVGPNPVSKNGMLNIFCLGNDNQAKVTLKNPIFVLYNQHGKEIKSFEVEEFSMTYIMTFQDISAGNYILTLKNDTGIVQSERIVVLN